MKIKVRYMADRFHLYEIEQRNLEIVFKWGGEEGRRTDDGEMKLMYNISLIRIVIMNPLINNDYIIIKI
jgi:hypothetical protein